MDEQTFLDQLATEPKDEVRLVYADWLDEDGQGDKAEFLRLEYQIRAARARIEELGPTLDPVWLGAVYGHNQLEIVTCPPDKRIQIIKLIRELTGLGLKDAKLMTDRLPSVVFEASGPELLVAKERFEALGAGMRLKGKASDLAWLVGVLGRGGLVLMEYPRNQKIRVIKELRWLTGRGLKEAKEMSESLPVHVLDGDELQLKKAKEALEACGATVRIVVASSRP